MLIQAISMSRKDNSQYYELTGTKLIKTTQQKFETEMENTKKEMEKILQNEIRREINNKMGNF